MSLSVSIDVCERSSGDLREYCTDASQITLLLSTLLNLVFSYIYELQAHPLGKVVGHLLSYYRIQVVTKGVLE